MHYPIINPVIVSFGELAVRWYGLSYLAGFAVVWWLGNRRARRHPDDWERSEISDLVFYGAMGAVLGGRIGYVLFYNFDYFLSDPIYLLQIWKGGMSFHGGLLGVMAGMALFAHHRKRRIVDVFDFLAPLTPIGLGFGRLANFINMELPGRVTDAPTGLIYPCDAVRELNPMCIGQWESMARHPSPLYQAFTEGLVLFVVIWLISARPRRAGLVSGCFLIGYGLLRSCTEFFRAPDAHIGFIAFDWLTMGQILSLPMVIAGILLLLWSRGQPLPEPTKAHPTH